MEKNGNIMSNNIVNSYVHIMPPMIISITYELLLSEVRA